MPNCGHCTKNPVTIHVAESVERDGATVWDVQHLCDNCAQMLGIAQTKQFDPIAMLHMQSFPVPLAAAKDVICPQCSLKLSEFRRTGRLGCEKCYESFQEPLKEVLDKAHAGKTQHIGRAPGMSDAEASRREHLASLHRRLRKAIECEAYEEAARVRDKIRLLDGEQSEQQL